MPVSSLDGDYYIYDETARALFGERTGKGYQLADRVEVRLVEVAPLAGALRFEMLSEPKPLPGRQTLVPQGQERSVRRGAASQPRAAQQEMTDGTTRFSAASIIRGRPARALWTAMARGFLGRCPNCGKGKLFALVPEDRRQHASIAARRCTTIAPTICRPIWSWSSSATSWSAAS